MEWVETTGRSVQEAKEAALDELGVDEADAEFEVLAEAQTGLFGRLRSEARVRARVRPTAPRPKEDRRGRERRRRGGNGGSAPAPTTSSSPATPGRSGSAVLADTPSGAARSSGRATTRQGSSVEADGQDGEAATSMPVVAAPEAETVPAEGSTRRRRRKRGANPVAAADTNGATQVEANDVDDEEPAKGSDVEVDLDRQGEVAAEFVKQLTAEFDIEATVTVVRPDDDTVEVQVTGADLGILIGPQGATLQAVQNLARTVVFNETGANNGHINVDVSGYRHKRNEALARFAEKAANQVKTSGQRVVLNPMSAVERKIVHDTIANIGGVSTTSEGEEPRRRVVVLPD